MNQQLYRYTGNPNQVYGVRRTRIAEGPATGCTLIEAYTADGLRADILPDMGLDIGFLTYKGVNMSFISKNGYDFQHAVLPNEKEFFYSFPGGMLYTCGLRNVGPSNKDGEERHSYHGRFHSLRATEVSAGIDSESITISGTLRESALFGACLQVKRQIIMPISGSSITIQDSIENLTPHEEEFMLMYHFMFGYPMLSEKARLVLPHKRRSTAGSGDDAAESALDFSAPIDGAKEQMFFHEMENCWARLENTSLNMAATLRWSGDSLPILAQWRSMASGDYALGLEPSNNYIMGRTKERERGTLQTLAGFGSLQTRLTVDFQTL